MCGLLREADVNFFKIPNKNVPGNISDSPSQTSARASCSVHADVDMNIDEGVRERAPKKFSDTHVSQWVNYVSVCKSACVCT